MALSPEHQIAVMIKTKWDATSALATSVPGGVRWDLMKQPADGSAISEPYCVFEITEGRSPGHCTGEGTITYRNVKFMVFGPGELACTGAGDIRAAFHRAALSAPSGGTFMHCLETQGRAQIPMWARESRMVWQAEWSCEIAVCLS